MASNSDTSATFSPSPFAFVGGAEPNAAPIAASAADGRGVDGAVTGDSAGGGVPRAAPMELSASDGRAAGAAVAGAALSNTSGDAEEAAAGTSLGGSAPNAAPMASSAADGRPVDTAAAPGAAFVDALGGGANVAAFAGSASPERPWRMRRSARSARPLPSGTLSHSISSPRTAALLHIRSPRPSRAARKGTLRAPARAMCGAWAAADASSQLA
mmetsp:Transcript_67921/g.118204  ORF Transcript_67921/g.118204 Transcript_67921/m.118204 type:complete len:214 (-) Transcript_67921:556-1197(-)